MAWRAVEQHSSASALDGAAVVAAAIGVGDEPGSLGRSTYQQHRGVFHGAAERDEEDHIHRHQHPQQEENELQPVGDTIFADENEIRSGSLGRIVERLVAEKPPGALL